MQFSSRFAIAIHMFACIDTFGADHKVTSKFLAGSINVNPVIIRQILGKLKAAGLLNSKQGSSGIRIAKDPEEISLLDIFQALEMIDHNQLFGFHENPSTDCVVGRNIHYILDDRLESIQQVLEEKLSSIRLSEVLADTEKYVNEKNVKK
ncbi:Rrf2 family transcriptional regulator [Streptococcus sciuri]|uniref:Rrf2 family transcriptional regulator n=1 Tax=Streptococcus sciuri TaxID=2973939 RepID=A0ABT2F7L1_9STRE|nr:Rrf2 family transcriptional regulator [Streptococcus sciuri]MCS4488448.1 Rrf2 family transcriptional regulator [Streptococcus sciuri]